MKVKEYIEYLKTLDQEKDIWVSYDCDYAIWEPSCSIAKEDRKRMKDIDGTVTIKKGDYVIEAW